MNRTTLTFALLATSALALVLPDVAAAQEAGGDIIVTARRVEERLQDVPVSVTVFNQQELTNKNVISAADLSKYTPSLSSNQRFGPDKASFAIRGFTQETNTSPSVGVYFAEVVAPRNLAFTTGGNGGGPGNFFDLQSVQVLRGPQGTLFGRNTTGGAILLAPQKPTDRTEGYAEVSLGNYDMVRLQGVVNAPLSDSARLRVGFDKMKREGYQDNQSGIGPKHFSDVNYFAVRASLVLDLSPTVENYTIASYSNSDTNGTRNRVFACQTNPLLRAGAAALMGDAACDQVARQNARGDDILDVEGSLANTRSLVEQWQVINTTTWTASDTLTVRHIGSYSEFREIYRGNSSGDNLLIPTAFNRVVNGQITQVPTGAAAGTPYGFVALIPFPGRYTSAQRSISEELQLRGKSGDGALTWQAGAYMERSDPLQDVGQITSQLVGCTNLDALQCRDVLSPFNGNAAIGSANTRRVRNYFRNYGLYAQATYKLTEQLAVTAGGRYTWDRHRQAGAQLSYQFPPATIVPAGTVRTFCSNTVAFPGPKLTANDQDCRVSFTAKSDKPTWVIDVEYKPIENILVFAKYSRGYRQGLANAFAPGFEILDPEKVDTYEAGVKTSWRGAMPGTFNVIGFYNKLENQQIQASANARVGSGVSSTNTVLNAGASTIKGVEVDLSLAPFEGFSINAGYAYLDTLLKSFAPPDLTGNPLFTNFSSSALAGGPLVLSPEHKLTVNVSYTLPLDESVGEVTLAGTYTYTGKQFSTFSSPLGRLPNTNLVNLNLNWKSVAGSDFDLSLFGTNVTNKKYAAFIVGSQTSTGFESLIPGEPRIIGVRLRYNFGD